MIEHIIPLIGSFLTNANIQYWFFPMIALAFLISVPGIVRQIFLGGR